MSNDQTTPEMQSLLNLGYATITQTKAKAIADALGNRFDELTQSALDGAPESIETLNAAVSSLSDFVSKKLTQARVTVPFTTRVAVATKDPASFLHCVASANKGDEQSCTDLVASMREGIQNLRTASSNSSKPQDSKPTEQSPRQVPNEPAQGNTNNQGNQSEHGRSIHFYGGKGAFCLAEDSVRASSMKTLRLEAAAKVGSGYDWQNKIAIQFTLKELLPFLAVCSRQIDFYEFKNHGQNSDKSFRIEFQNGKSFFFSMNQAKRPAIAIPVPMHEMYLAITMILKQLVSNDPHMGVDHFLDMTKTLVPVSSLPERRAAA